MINNINTSKKIIHTITLVISRTATTGMIFRVLVCVCCAPAGFRLHEHVALKKWLSSVAKSIDIFGHEAEKLLLQLTSCFICYLPECSMLMLLKYRTDFRRYLIHFFLSKLSRRAAVEFAADFLRKKPSIVWLSRWSCRRNIIAHIHESIPLSHG